MGAINTTDANVDYNKMMADLPGNQRDHASTLHPGGEDKKRLKKVISAGIKPKKKSFLQKFKEAWLPEADMELSDYVIGDILVPGLKNVVSGVLTNSIEMVLFGEIRSSNRRRGGRYVSYDSYYDDRDRIPDSGRGRRSSSRVSYTSRSALNFDSDIFESRNDAVGVLSEMVAHIGDYGHVSLGDYYDLIGKTGEFTDWKFGWVDLGDTKVFQERGGGYVIDFPKPMRLE